MSALLRKTVDLLRAARILIVAASVPLLLRLPLARLQSVLEPRRAPSAPEPERVRKLVERIESTLAGGNPLIRPGCLTRGVTLYYFLRRAGVDVRLAFGIGQPGPDGEFAGHCWLVESGEPFLERVDPRAAFTEMYSIPAA